MTSRIPLYLIKQELEQYGMTVEELETSAKRIRTTLETFDRTVRGLKCPNCGLPNVTAFLSKAGEKGEFFAGGKHKIKVKAQCNTGGSPSNEGGWCGYMDEFVANESYEDIDRGTHNAILNEMIMRYKRHHSKDMGKRWSDDALAHKSMWLVIKRGGFQIGKGLGAKKISGQGVVSEMIRRTTYAGVIAKKLRDLNPSQRDEFLRTLESLGRQKAEEFLKNISSGNVPASSTRPRGRPKRGRGRPPSRKSGEWYEPSKMTRMEDELDIMELEINRINEEE